MFVKQQHFLGFYGTLKVTMGKNRISQEVEEYRDKTKVDSRIYTNYKLRFAAGLHRR